MTDLPRNARIADIITLAAEIWGVPESVITGPSRTREHVSIRGAVVAVACDQKARYSYPSIGRWLGGRDHSTILNLHRRFDTYFEFYPDFAENYTELRRRAEIEGPFVRERRGPIALPAPRAERDRDRRIRKALEAMPPLGPKATDKPRNRFLSGDDELVSMRVNMRAGSKALAAKIEEARNLQSTP